MTSNITAFYHSKSNLNERGKPKIISGIGDFPLETYIRIWDYLGFYDNILNVSVANLNRT